MSKYKSEIDKLYNLRKNNLTYEINHHKPTDFANLDRGLIFNISFELIISNSETLPDKDKHEDFKIKMSTLNDVITFLNELDCRRNGDELNLQVEYNTKRIEGRPFYMIIYIYKFPYCK
jgi:hypothetical protein